MNWKAIPGPKPDYEISETGQVRSNKYGRGWRMLKPRLAKIGYYQVCLSYGVSNHEKRNVHRLLAEAFIPNPENKGTVNHKNGIKTDNRLDNLEWVTQAENTQHAHRTGLRKKQKSKYTDEQIEHVIKLRKAGMSQIEISKITGVNQGMVCCFLMGYRTKFKTMRELRAAVEPKRFFGEMHPMSVLNEAQVREIRKRFSQGESMWKIHKDFGVSYPTINNVCHNRIWKHVI